MDSDFLMPLLEKFPLVMILLSALGSLVVIGQAIVLMTPSKDDDAKLLELEKGPIGKVMDFLKRFAVIQKK